MDGIRLLTACLKISLQMFLISLLLKRKAAMIQKDILTKRLLQNLRLKKYVPFLIRSRFSGSAAINF